MGKKTTIDIGALTLENWFERNLDTETRTVYMGSISTSWQDDAESGVDNFMAEFFIKGMHVLEKKSTKEPITVIMNNPGGDWYHGMAIYDAIKTSSCPVFVKVYGYAMSMGSIILQAADRRILMPNSRVMIHFGYDSAYGHSKIVEKTGDESKQVNYQMENIYLECMMKRLSKVGRNSYAGSLKEIVNRQRMMSFPPNKLKTLPLPPMEKKRMTEELRKWLKELLNFDTYLSPQEAISLGFADEIFKKSK